MLLSGDTTMILLNSSSDCHLATLGSESTSKKGSYCTGWGGLILSFKGKLGYFYTVRVRSMSGMEEIL